MEVADWDWFEARSHLNDGRVLRVDIVENELKIQLKDALSALEPSEREGKPAPGWLVMQGLVTLERFDNKVFSEFITEAWVMPFDGYTRLRIDCYGGGQLVALGQMPQWMPD